MKPEPLPKFIDRMKGRVFMAADLKTVCGIPEHEALNRIQPYKTAGRVVSEGKAWEVQKVIWRAI